MYAIGNKSEQCIDCPQKENRTNEGWFICQDCQKVFCGQHSIIHRHYNSDNDETGRYDRQVHLDQIAEWERKAIERIRKQANDARRPLLAPPTPMTPTSPDITLLNESTDSSFLQRLSSLSLSKKNAQSLSINQYELLSNESLDELIGDGPLTCPPDERKLPGRISFASLNPYINGRHHLRLLIEKFTNPTSWAFVGIISEGLRTDKSNDQTYLNRSSFGWHIGRQSIIYDRRTSIGSDFDGRQIRQGDILTIFIDCDQKLLEIKNERTLSKHTIYINSDCCPLPWLFAVNFNYQNNDSMYLLH